MPFISPLDRARGSLAVFFLGTDCSLRRGCAAALPSYYRSTRDAEVLVLVLWVGISFRARKTVALVWEFALHEAAQARLAEALCTGDGRGWEH